MDNYVEGKGIPARCGSPRAGMEVYSGGSLDGRGGACGEGEDGAGSFADYNAEDVGKMKLAAVVVWFNPESLGKEIYGIKKLIRNCLSQFLYR